ncbi:MAG: RNA polymerase sigma factor [Proteobacteria bacterium]|nr:RNA polymerase sigma factor [Pseudomonadota bacterium]MCP4919610.1 RNA polymerase sigma factor [Pseudomonadota bacterium]
MTDADCMRALATGDLSALAPLHDRHAQAIRSLLLRLDSQLAHESAEDLCQEVFLTLADKAGRYQEQGKLRSFLFGIAVRQARSARRRRAWRNVLHFRQGDASAGVALRADRPDARAEARMEVQRALDGLSANHREILVLAVVEGLPGAEVAAALDISENAVWTRLHRARKALGERL